MGLPKKKNHGTLGRAMIKNRFQGQKAFAVDEGKLVRNNGTLLKSACHLIC
jgi:hypothetical protein